MIKNACKCVLKALFRSQDIYIFGLTFGRHVGKRLVKKAEVNFRICDAID